LAEGKNFSFAVAFQNLRYYSHNTDASFHCSLVTRPLNHLPFLQVGSPLFLTYQSIHQSLEITMLRPNSNQRTAFCSAVPIQNLPYAYPPTHAYIYTSTYTHVNQRQPQTTAPWDTTVTWYANPNAVSSLSSLQRKFETGYTTASNWKPSNKA
jgi:hypothetical protein